MRIDTTSPTPKQLASLYEQGLIYNLHDLPQGEHRVFVNPRLTLRHKDAKDFKSRPFFLHAAQMMFATNTTPIDIISTALAEHPALVYYTLGKRRFHFNTLLSSALTTGRVFVV